ncbi:hypothetical protein [Aeoliella sp. SH292]|uniref:hypothetical protein n=1 Tax=Aeoliella sp. SH292 TaxID=3454464 RepID=UPI003F972C95
MSWLVGSKILPPFMRGEPPRTGINANEPVCWKVRVGEQQIGWAVSQAVPGADGTTELHSRVQLEAVPLARMAPRWMSTVIDNIGPLEMDMRSRTTLDSLGNLSMFEASVEINDLPSAIVMKGTVDEGHIRLRLQYGEVLHQVNYPWPKHALLGSNLTPDSTIMQAYTGRKWQKEVYNPFGGPQGAIEVIEAEVVGEEPLHINGQLTNTRRIDYRSMDSTGVSSDERRRSTMWIAEDGKVLREEINLMDVLLRFDREPELTTKQIAAELLQLDEYATLSASQRAELTSPEN